MIYLTVFLSLFLTVSFTVNLQNIEQQIVRGARSKQINKIRDLKQKILIYKSSGQDTTYLHDELTQLID